MARHLSSSWHGRATPAATVSAVAGAVDFERRFREFRPSRGEKKGGEGGERKVFLSRRTRGMGGIGRTPRDKCKANIFATACDRKWRKER